MLQLHTRRTENGSHRSRGSTLFPNHFANVALGDAQSNDGGLTIWNRLDRDVARVIDKSTRDLTDEVCHIRYRIPPWRRLSCLSHYTPSVLGVTKKRSSSSLRPVCSEIFWEVLKRANSGRRQSSNNADILLCNVQQLTMQYQGVYVKRCAGHTARTLVRQLSLGTIIIFPKLAVTK